MAADELTHSPRIPEIEIIAEIVLLPVTDPFGRRFLAVIFGILIIEGTIITAMQVCPAVRTNLLSADLTGSRDFFAAGMTNAHGSLYNKNDARGRNFRGRKGTNMGEKA